MSFVNLSPVSVRRGQINSFWVLHIFNCNLPAIFISLYFLSTIALCLLRILVKAKYSYHSIYLSKKIFTASFFKAQDATFFFKFSDAPLLILRYSKIWNAYLHMPIISIMIVGQKKNNSHFNTSKNCTLHLLIDTFIYKFLSKSKKQNKF